VGNFEDAVYAWRGAVAAGTGDDARALLLASGGGALGLRIADPALEARWASHEQGYEPAGTEPGTEGLRSAVGLVWRSVVLWIALFAMLSAANWLGR
jgi:adenosylcobinamide-phosphate synthase